MKKSKRVIFLLSSFSFGGAERQALLLAHNLRYKNRYTVIFATIGSFEGELLNILNEESFEAYKLDVPWRWRDFHVSFKFIKELKNLKPNIIISFCRVPNITASLTYKLVGAEKCIWNQADEGLGKYFLGSGKFASKLPTHIVSNSEGGKTYLINSLKVPENRVKLIYNGTREIINDDVEWRKKNNFHKNDLIACKIANLSKNKDHITLIKAWDIVVKLIGEKAKLVLVGAFAGTENTIRSLVVELKLQDNVILLGYVKDVDAVILNSNLGIFSSHSEGGPNGLLESMSGGLAIAGTDISGIRDFVSEYNLPFLSPINNYNALAENIITLLNDSVLRDKIGKNNQRRIKDFFSVEHFLSRYNKLINK